MTIYLWAIGNDIALVSLDTIDPQPSFTPAQPVDRTFSVTGKVRSNGLFAIAHWDMVQDEGEYFNLLQQIGLDEEDESDCTILIQDERMQEQRYNAKALLPEMGTDARRANFFPRDINIYFVDLEALVD